MLHNLLWFNHFQSKSYSRTSIYVEENTKCLDENKMRKSYGIQTKFFDHLVYIYYVIHRRLEEEHQEKFDHRVQFDEGTGALHVETSAVKGTNINTGTITRSKEKEKVWDL